MVRLYISKLNGDGSEANPYRAAWWDILGGNIPERHGQTVESNRYYFWIGQLDTDDAQHSALMADTMVRSISQSLLTTTIANLTQNQRDAVVEIYSWLGFPINIWNQNNAKVSDILFYVMGKACWHPISQAADA